MTAALIDGVEIKLGRTMLVLPSLSVRQYVKFRDVFIRMGQREADRARARADRARCQRPTPPLPQVHRMDDGPP